ncbi:hypothetical protein [Massilibacteroides sp.]|uniref:hypothetical protein n=1 Tax=Massilibacteroides sp. TaxID=2034766 RepID=UPI00260C72B9|nr:hypothetical protein [Massilibacteroides sp.]MDD4515670.1 hypothetical protein [Massilibacteroides sp.]
MDNWLWKKPEYYQWFSYLLFRANFKENKVLIGSDFHILKRGEFITSLEKLQKDLNNSSIQKIRTFLKLCENDGMIVVKSTSKLTKITICKYDEYQYKQQTDNKRTTNEQQTNNKPTTTENKVKKVKKENNNKIPSFDDFEIFAKDKCIEYGFIFNTSILKQKFDAWVLAGWKDGNDVKIKNWKSKLINNLKYIFDKGIMKEEKKETLWPTHFEIKEGW